MFVSVAAVAFCGVLHAVYEKRGFSFSILKIHTKVLINTSDSDI